jgi:hypothetical protein
MVRFAAVATVRFNREMNSALLIKSSEGPGTTEAALSRLLLPSETRADRELFQRADHTIAIANARLNDVRVPPWAEIYTSLMGGKE